MRLIARSTLVTFWEAHPETKASLEHWIAVTSQAQWQSASEVQSSFSKAKVLNGERVRFEVAGGNYRLIIAFQFEAQIAFVKFIGTHKQYDAINALTISAF
jgi:mRNA interferase HigB